MAVRVEDFVYTMLTQVLNAQETAPLAIEAILKAGSFDPGPKAERIEDPEGWTREKIIERAKLIDSDKGPGDQPHLRHAGEVGKQAARELAEVPGDEFPILPMQQRIGSIGEPALGTISFRKSRQP